MVNFNVHWKGCPHQNFPRIQFTSKLPEPEVVFPTGRCTAHTTGKQCEISSCRALEQARRKQKLLNRKSRGSRASSSIARSRGRATLRAKQNIQVFGWESPGASLVVGDDQSTQANEHLFPSTEVIVGSRAATPSEIVSTDGIIDSVDGAALSAFKRFRAGKARDLYSLMHVPEGRKVRRFNQRKAAGGANQPPSIPSTYVHREYAHVGPIVSNQVSNPNARPETPGQSSYRTYDSRILYKKYSPSTRTIQPSSAASQVTNRQTQPRNNKAFLAASTLASLYEEAAYIHKEQGSTSGEPGKKENNKLLETSTLRSLARRKSFSSSVHSIVKTIASTASSRSPSQKRALKRFTKELQVYLQLARRLPALTPISSAPSTAYSLQTIKTIQEFKPYRAEFQAAGLAVTSADQRRKIVSGIVPHQVEPQVEVTTKPITEAFSKIDHSQLGNLPRGTTPKNQRRRSLSDIGQSTAPALTTEDKMDPAKSPNVLKKKSMARLNADSLDRRARERETSEMSMASDDTIIDWTPKLELQDPISRLAVPPSRAPPTPPAQVAKSLLATESTPKPLNIRKTPTKKSLPWLRNSKLQPAEPIPTYTTPARHSKLRSQFAGDANQSPPWSEFTSQPDSQSSSIVLHLDTPPEHKRYTPAKTPKTTRASLIPTIPTTTSYPEPFNSPEDEGDVVILDSAAAARRKRLSQDRTLISQIVNEPDPPSIIDQATQTSAAPSLMTRAPLFSAQIPSLYRGQPRRGFASKVPQAVAGGPATKEPAPPHQISRSVSQMHPSPPRCNRCNIELQNSVVRLRGDVVSIPELNREAGLDPRYGTHLYDEPLTMTCNKCSVANSGVNSVTGRSTLPTSSLPVREAKTTHDSKMHVSSKRKGKEPAVVAEEGYYARQSAVRKSGETIKEEVHSSRHSEVRKSGESSKQGPLPDPTKRQTRTPATTIPNTASSAPLPDQVISYTSVPVLLNIPSSTLPLSDSNLTSQLAFLEASSSQAQSKKLFKGLRVATAAACEEDFDRVIEDITGYKARKMLMDLSALDGLGVNALADMARRTARKRRGELAMLEGEGVGVGVERGGSGSREGKEEKVKGKKGPKSSFEEETHRVQEKGTAKEKETEKQEKLDRRLGLVAADQGVRLREEGEDVYMGMPVSEARERQGVGRGIVRGMGMGMERERVGQKREKESLKERAIRMGWREKSEDAG